MISAHDLLYLALTLCSVVVTAMVVLVGVQLFQVLQDVKDISHDVSRMSDLLERVASVVFPGMERVAKRADRIEEKVGSFLEKKVDKLMDKK